MPVITISRHYGAGGKTLGELVAKKLGYAFFDNELIQMVSEKAKVSPDGIHSFEAEAAGRFQKFISSMVPRTLVDLIRQGKAESIKEEIYVDLLNQIIKRIAGEGNAVIIGRASQYILEGLEGVYHLLVVAERKDRIKFMADKYNLSPVQAEQAVDLDDRRRANLYYKFGKMDYDDLHIYHMVLNMSKLSKDAAAELICEMVG